MTSSINITSSNPNKGRTSEDLDRLKGDHHFLYWYDRLQQNIQGSVFEGETVQTKDIEVSDVDMFGPKFGFGKFNVVTKPFIPGIVFHRSPSVCCLFIIHSEGQRYVLLTVQARIPAGYRNFPELVAGMVDDETGGCRLVAVKEIKEETGIDVVSSDLVDLGEANAFMAGNLESYICKSTSWPYHDWLRNNDPNRSHTGWFNSAGGSTEATKFYLYQTSMGSEEFNNLLQKMEGETHGLREEGESIRLVVVPIEDILEVSPSVTAGHALALLERYERQHGTTIPRCSIPTRYNVMYWLMACVFGMMLNQMGYH